MPIQTQHGRRAVLPTSTLSPSSFVLPVRETTDTGYWENVPNADAVGRRLLVVGSSPICLLIALTASRSGYAVTLVERSDRLGGAWAVDEVEGRLIDRACHLLEPLAPARRWVFEQLGEEPMAYPHPPTAITPWDSIWPISSRRYRALELAMALPAATRHIAMAAIGDRQDFRRVLAECRHDLGRLTRRAVQELWSGPSQSMTFSPQPFAHLCELVVDSVDEVRLSQNVARISHVSSTGAYSVNFNGLEERFDQVVVPSGADIEISVAGHQLPHRQFHFENHHLLFEATAGERNLSYVAFMANPAVRRVTDTGPDASPDSGRHLYLAQVRGPDVSVEDVAQLLARHGYIDASTETRLVRHYRFTSTRTSFLGPLPPGLWAPDTYGDLSDNLARLLELRSDGEVHLRLPFAPFPELRSVR